MFLKQTSYKPRSNSQSSTGSTKEAGAALSQSPPKDTKTSGTNTTEGPVSAGIQGRRRSSATKFSGLNTHKRNSSDEASAARKASFAEQKPGSQGIIGGMWNTFTKGS